MTKRSRVGVWVGFGVWAGAGAVFASCAGLLVALPSSAYDAAGTDGSDHIVGSQAADNIWGFGGNDTLEGRGGDDQVWGNDGNDQLYGGAGDDVLIGGKGSDVIFGDDGVDVVELGTGQDIAYAGPGDDVITNVYVDYGAYYTDDGVLLWSAPDRIDCGPGVDKVYVTTVDPNDTYLNCEHVL